MADGDFGAAVASAITGRARAGVFPHGPQVILRFDDGYRDNLLNAAPILERHGMRGTLYTGTDPVNWLGGTHGGHQLLTPAQVVSLHEDYGWEIGSHTRLHIDALSGGLGLVQYGENLRDSINDILGMGLPYPVSFAFPNGSTSSSMNRCAYRYFQNLALTGGPNNYLQPWDAPQCFSGWAPVGSSAPDSGIPRVKRYIEQELTSGRNAIVGMHSIVNDDNVINGYDLRVSDFAGLMAWIYANRFPVGLMRDLKPHNQLWDPGFERSAVDTGANHSHPWTRSTAPGWVRAADTSDGLTGSYVMRLDASTFIPAASSTSFSQQVPARPGGIYKIHLRWRQPAWTQGEVRLNLYHRDFLGTQIGSTVVGAWTAGATTAGWTDSSTADFTIPAGAARTDVTFQSSTADGYQGSCDIGWVGMVDVSIFNPMTAA